MVDFVEICDVCARKAVIEAAKRIINSALVCRSYSDFNFGVTFLEHSVYIRAAVVTPYNLNCHGGCYGSLSGTLRVDLHTDNMQYRLFSLFVFRYDSSSFSSGITMNSVPLLGGQKLLQSSPTRSRSENSLKPC